MLLIVDLEATCWDISENKSRNDMEIIEIGATLLMDEQIKSKYIDYYTPTFSIFVKPVKYPILSEYCKNLTSIEQENVNNANLFPEALKLFIRKVESHLGFKSIGNIIWGSWGMFDKNQFQKDCDFHNVKYPFGEHWNIKESYSKSRGTKKGFGLAKALKQLDLEFIGNHHRGIDDSIMISKIVRKSLSNCYREMIRN